MIQREWNSFECPLCHAEFSAEDRRWLATLISATEIGNIGVVDVDGRRKLGCGHTADALIDRTFSHDRFSFQVSARAVAEC